MKIIIVGGVAGGMSAATRLRRLDESAEIIVFERGHYVSFANCGLPYFVGGIIRKRSDLLLQTPESLGSRFALDVRIDTEVVQIDRVEQTVSVRNLLTGEESLESYDRLVLAAGASARSGATDSTIPTHTLRTVDDVDHITAVLAGVETASAVVIGGGFIGLEAIENLVHRGVQVTLVQRGSQIFTPLDPEMAAPVLDRLRERGVDVRLGTVATGASGQSVTLSDGTAVPADLVIDASGVRPDVTLAEQAGLRIGESGGVWVDGTQATSDPLIFAVGDGVEKTDAVDGSGTLVTMAGLANRHGRSVADSIAGTPEQAEPAVGAGIVAIFGLTVATVGWNEKHLIAAGRAHRIAHTHPANHAGYFPGAEGMSIKLLIDAATDAILGAQIVGGAGVDKRIDVLAVAMAAGLTASALTRLELAYAPQYASAKDPINQLGYVADNLAQGTSVNLQWHELEAARAAGAVLVDVRSAGEFAAGSIPGALNVSLDELRARLADLPPVPLIVHCQVGQRGHTAARILTQHGFDVRNLDGGYRTWLAGTVTSPILERALA
ncbi:CoA-disulfide reductase [Cryobacterium levicorallinum]|uniref:CoA-disulfide reductase n=1 Tax=Cryobacterium levicorallinum TaxID=995038 RepID=A0A1I2YL60_9MICO|nr:FAD-dependent oxidoreductase [Cryobacterium levicorallinum]TFB85996.1 CoA-disulfide reductase [Cryobacterium levicorallinum]GEP27150.1 NADH dehydrogenase [Cryobacterium levicorallinum]SFH25786.1 NADPH-dependent 2,4-dienoyl-CoA reductase, sulfur reductase [Cryobacterium levicorallinum]